MLINLATKIFGSSNDRVLKNFYKHVAPINELESRFMKLKDAELQAMTAEFRQRLDNGEPLDSLTHEAFAVVREAAKRTLGQRHFDVQLVGGLVLNDSKIAEMKTGEGKTLVATLPTYLNAVGGKGVHVVTVNDYLAKRDAEWMGQIYKFLGLSVGCITHDLQDHDRRAAYAADVTYGTNNEFGFDYLRDNMKYRLEDMSQRDFNFAIVDEVDSILIDEARTPLIISGPSENSSELYVAVDKIIPQLESADYEVDEKMKTVILNERGTEHVETLLDQAGLITEGNLYDAQNITLVHHVNQALRAHKLFAPDTDYIVKDDKVVIIDEFTGRMMEGRRFSEGLHQALEAKEKVAIQNENQTLASITFQNYFRMYPKLAGMTGTAMTEAAEFASIYNLGVVEIPTNVPVSRIDHDDKIYKSLAEKDEAIIQQIEECRERNQPVLVGTISIDKSEKLAEQLKKHKIPHSVLNARYHEQEAQIISQAGRPGAVTIATNMAGRGTDIKMGGDAEMRIADEVDESWTDAKKEKAIAKIREEVARDKETVKEAGGLFIIGTERHESRRIDNQLRGRSGRQGDPGGTIFFLSLEDDLMRIFGSDKMEMLLSHKHIGLRDGEALTHPWISKALERAQAKVEAQNFEIRKNLLKFDNVMNDQRKVIYDQRREIMAADDAEELLSEMRYDVIEAIINNCIPFRSYVEQWDIDTLKSEVTRVLALDLPIEDWAKEEGVTEEEVSERINDAADRKMAEKAANTGPDIFRKMEKALLLQQLDKHWKEHLLNLDHLRQGISLRAFGQRDPLNEYKTEAFGMFEAMLDQLRESTTQLLSLVELNVDADAGSLLMRRAASTPTRETRQDPALMGSGGPRPEQARSNVAPFPERRAFNKDDPETWGKVQRNALCPCGSGNKYKHCHGKIV
ncbi:MAG: preprotein translocase subunit SecA [Rhodospirillales bacterium]|nr:preprotein translocase subunit SecA [Rhodospirillales bacterium]